MYGIYIYNSKNRNIDIGTNKGKKFSLDIYSKAIHDPLEELLNGFREGQFRTTLTSKQKLILLKMLRKNRPAFPIGEEPLGKIRGHDIELYLYVELPNPPMLRRPPYPASLEIGLIHLYCGMISHSHDYEVSNRQRSIFRLQYWGSIQVLYSILHIIHVRRGLCGPQMKIFTLYW
ncbi:hypothetical protein O181_019019 [Austropuccinia psidii MF-1]|uniref:Uncharacterized protein n=1 Tax=Austropuccinia psidii MF-1 TaxID=1389203 RepID=A0A9Q3GUB4_9BASI|nr:hypothetical protein [Austropuccinia psidii MF-1]